MTDHQYTMTELGMICGMGIGAAIALILMALTGEIMWIMVMGAGIALGTGLGATWEQKGR